MDARGGGQGGGGSTQWLWHLLAMPVGSLVGAGESQSSTSTCVVCGCMVERQGLRPGGRGCALNRKSDVIMYLRRNP